VGSFGTSADWSFASEVCPLRVLQLSKFYPPVLGGIEAVAWELTEGLNRAGVRTDVLCSNQALRSTREQTTAGYTVLRAACLGMVLSTSMAPAMLLYLARMAARADLVHVHMPDPMAAAALWVVRPRARLVVHWHSDVIRQRRALKVYEPLQRWLLQHAEAIIATSPPYAEASLALQPWRSKVAVVPIGISDNRTSDCSMKAAAIRQRFRGRRIVFALGRMTYYKGFEVLIQAAAALPEDCVVLIGGQGDLLEHYRSMVLNRGLTGKVVLPGHINDDELPSHFEACDIFCMPSTVRAEAYGVAMVEAMMMGKPVVASNIGGSGVPWVNLHGLTGLNVAANNPAALTAALADLLLDDARRAGMGRAARARYDTHFQAGHMVQQVHDVYRRILRGQPTDATRL
jgi:glycosyltransferase involved in cell wall biosynthesis